jgi:HPt (histidine-containing phosphotransfer) domain-containing protein
MPGEAAEELRALQEQFAQRLPARLAEIDEAWRAARDSGWEPGALRLLLRLSHSLSGAAATFGFPAVAAAAARLESFLQEITRAGGPPVEQSAERLAGLLDELQRIAATLPPSPL